MARAFQSGIDLLGQLATAIGATLSSGKLLGRSSAGSGSIEEISIGSNLTLSGGVLSAVASGVNGYVAGNWVLPYQGSTVSGSALSANSINCSAFTVSKNITVNGLGARIATASASNNLQLAIYASGANRLPTGTPLASTGNLSTASSTTVSGSVTSFSLAAGEIYWGCVNTSGTPSMQTVTAGTVNLGAMAVGASTLATLTTGPAANSIYWSIGQTFGTWPDVTSLSKTPAVTLASAVIYLQVASIP